MPKPPTPISELNQTKAGLHDDHDPRDPAQQQKDMPKGDYKAPSDVEDTPPDSDVTGGVGSQGGM